MKTKTLWLLVLVAAGLALTAGAAGALPVILDAEADVAGTINYQGRLTNPGGRPLEGTFPMRFQIYDDPVAGTFLWDSGLVSVDVDNGLFNVELNVDANDFDGRGLWLRIYVDGEWLTPRQSLLPVPYALSLKPGAEIQGQPTETGHVLRVEMTGTNATRAAVWGYTSTGDAVRGTSAGGWGLAGYTNDGYAVRGVDTGFNTARGYGGYFTSSNGVGVYGYSGGQSHSSNMYAPGVYGKSTNGVGVYGVSDASDSPGYGGYFDGRVGVGARSTGMSYTGGYAGTFVSTNYRGIYAISQDGWYDAYFPGDGGIYSAGGIFSSAADQTLVTNGGQDQLEPGDVVAIAGTVEAPQGGGVLLAVRKVDATNSAAVVGVVSQAMRVELKEMEGAEFVDVQPVEGSIAPQGYLTIVTHGLAPVVKVETASLSLELGDLLTVSATPGSARQAESGMESAGTILGKVAGPVDTQTGTVPVFVVLH